ncbi:TetR/AcrR family transcriptional regulator [Paraburkholderia oxyphila]|uniref:TetR/AcrR family transcriptional regulator n=1 Tax=Paraburkholderia oxyphila TaxID=614212 RepID=UPI0007C50C49|nr:TetR/AcrR family transcriptional regulator [Paraburkholderia oxyphila]
MKQDLTQTTSGRSKSRRAAIRDSLESEILLSAERTFAQCGYEGTSLAKIGEDVGLSKQNLLYYFPSKRALYTRVLDNVLDAWLESMQSLADGKLDPSEALRAYIAAKLRFSRERPWGSRVYGMEVITGARFYRKDIKRKLVPHLRTAIEVFERWIKAGEIAPTNATHLFFVIWAMTQSYADFSVQMALVMNRRRLTIKDFEAAEKLITGMVLAVIRPKTAGPAIAVAETSSDTVEVKSPFETPVAR